jgi:hypothetical protein
MIPNSPKNAQVLRWQILCWGLTLPAVPLVLWACTSHPLTQPTPAPQQETDIQITVAPVRKLDMVFMIDNSPSMGPKQEKLKLQFPNLINALKDPGTGTLPDLRVAIIDSDLGTNNALTSGNCGPNRDNGNNYFGDNGKFRMVAASSCGVTDPNAMWLEYKDETHKNFIPPAGGDISTVFACLAGGLGTMGCGEEHQLQAFEFALVLRTIGNDAQHALIRPEAYLGLVFLTDEDDCSAAWNDDMFGSSPGGSDLSAESPSLRCSTRAYTCKGTGNLSDGTGLPAAPGYPATKSFQAAWADCSPRTDYCPNPELDGKYVDVSKPTNCNPLRDLKAIANGIKGLKSDPRQVLVAGIFGWPVGGDFTEAEPVKIAPRPNPNAGPGSSHPTLLDYWSFCYDPKHRPTNLDPVTGNDAEAWGWGAGPGLRESAFIDEFGDNGLKFSICEEDYTNALTKIGTTLAARLQNLCVNYKLWINPATGRPDCRVAYSVPGQDPKDPNSLIYTERPDSLPQCDPSYSVSNPPPDSFGDCWMLTTGSSKCPDAYNGQEVTVLRTAKELAVGPLTTGTKINMQCTTCTDFVDQNGKPLPGC